jgi:hypothetical protein
LVFGSDYDFQLSHMIYCWIYLMHSDRRFLTW